MTNERLSVPTQDERRAAGRLPAGCRSSLSVLLAGVMCAASIGLAVSPLAEARVAGKAADGGEQLERPAARVLD